MTDPLETLAGMDPYPRQQIDLLGLHRERAELLEEIVSTPGPGKPVPSTRAKVLLPIGIAAALAIVGGVVWLASSGDPSSGDDPVVAASTTPDVNEPQPADERSEEASPDAAPAGEGDGLRVGGVRAGEVLSLEECRRVRGGKLPELLLQVPEPKDPTQGPQRRARLYYTIRRNGRDHDLVVDQDCRVVAVSNRRGLTLAELDRLLEERSDRKRR